LSSSGSSTTHGFLRYASGGAGCEVVDVERELDIPRKSSPSIEQLGLWGVALLRYASGLIGA
jgi:hypothetical protein